MGRILAIDLGSSQMKLLTMDETGRVTADVTARYETLAAPGGYLTQRPEDWEKALLYGITRLSQGPGLAEVEAISFSGHMSGVVLVDREGKPLYPCIMLADSRSGEECEAISGSAGELIQPMTGNPVIDAFSLPKLLWLKRHEPECYGRAALWLSPKDYIRFLLTGKAETEYTDAYNSLCLTPAGETWSEDIIRAAGLDVCKFPTVHKPYEQAGEVSREAARKYGLRQGIPVFYGAADMACGAVGNGLFEVGDSTLTLGTCATFLTMAQEVEERFQGKITYHTHVLPGRMYALGSHFCGGLAVNWFSGLFSGDGKVDYVQIREMSKEAKGIPAGCRGLLTIPFLAGSGSPYFNPADRQCMIGMDTATTRAQLFRSQLEGVTYNLRQSLELFEALAGNKLKPVVLGGGGIRVDVWPQMISDVFRIPLRIAQNPDASSVGAALIGGYGCGMFPDMEAIARKTLEIERIVEPDPENQRIYQKEYERFVRVYQMLHG